MVMNNNSMLSTAGKEGMCQNVCMLQLHPITEELSNCPACARHMPEQGFEQHQAILTLFEFSVSRKSLVPLGLRTMMSQTSVNQFMSTVHWQVNWLLPLLSL